LYRSSSLHHIYLSLLVRIIMTDYELSQSFLLLPNVRLLALKQQIRKS